MRNGRFTPVTKMHRTAHDTVKKLVWVLDNLRSVCRACHNFEHPDEVASWPKFRYYGILMDDSSALTKPRKARGLNES